MSGGGAGGVARSRSAQTTMCVPDVLMFHDSRTIRPSAHGTRGCSVSSVRNMISIGDTDTRKILYDCWGRKRMKAFEYINDGASAPSAGATEIMHVDDVIASISKLSCIDIDYV
ncbi:hypothetical protein EVAR_84448_1 [Eumeta japonica]|uniref:Uncharacterized protein n=1 Tax=Eumeta variegata TaxID=151549 RepID=A0A4C1W4F0_EUMVA|nr:hypothetical protein EVAR_84448_1 [Eumeta japonica]